MLSSQLFFMLLICQEGQQVFVEPDSVCQAKVIQECSDHSQGLLKAIENGNKRLLRKECDSLQVTIDCLSFPRCPGNLLQAFRYIVLTAATTLKKTSDACHKMDVSILERYARVFSMTCENNEKNEDVCGRRCKCKNGNLVSCYRVRKEFTKMSLGERKRFIKALKLVSTDARYRSEYDKLTNIHLRIPSKLLHHMPQIFLPWHRWYLLEFENLLRQIDCRITIPYWDWSKDAAHWTRGSEIEDAWNPGPHGLGGNGVFPDKCVMDGPFKKGEFSLPRAAGGGCLKRNFNNSCNPPNAEYSQNLVKQTNFTVFEKKIREVFHSKFHDCVGESMYCFLTAAYTPEFWLHHGFIDKLWVDWQKNREGNIFVYYLGISFIMPGSGRFPWEYLDADQLPGDVHVLYED